MTNYLNEDAALIRSLVPDDLSIPPNSDALFLIYAVLLRAKDSAVTASDVHDAWAAWMQLTDSDHSALAPFETLDEATQDEDRPFVNAIRKAAHIKASLRK